MRKLNARRRRARPAGAQARQRETLSLVVVPVDCAPLARPTACVRTFAAHWPGGGAATLRRPSSSPGRRLIARPDGRVAGRPAASLARPMLPRRRQDAAKTDIACAGRLRSSACLWFKLRQRATGNGQQARAHTRSSSRATWPVCVVHAQPAYQRGSIVFESRAEHWLASTNQCCSRRHLSRSVFSFREPHHQHWQANAAGFSRQVSGARHTSGATVKPKRVRTRATVGAVRWPSPDPNAISAPRRPTTTPTTTTTITTDTTTAIATTTPHTGRFQVSRGPLPMVG